MYILRKPICSRIFIVIGAYATICQKRKKYFSYHKTVLQILTVFKF